MIAMSIPRLVTMAGTLYPHGRSPPMRPQHGSDGANAWYMHQRQINADMLALLSSQYPVIDRVPLREHL